MGAEPTSCDNERPPTTGHHQLLAGIPTRSGRSFCKWDWNQLVMFGIATMTRLSMFNPNVPPNQTFPLKLRLIQCWNPNALKNIIVFFNGYHIFLSGFIMFHPPFWWLHRVASVTSPHLSIIAIGQWWPMRWWVASLGAVLGLNKEEAPWPWELQ